MLYILYLFSTIISSKSSRKITCKIGSVQIITLFCIEGKGLVKGHTVFGRAQIGAQVFDHADGSFHPSPLLSSALSWWWWAQKLRGGGR